MRRLLLFLPLFFLAPAAVSQTDDFGAWMTFSINKGIAGKLDLNFDQEFRLRYNLTDVNLFYTNVGLAYRFTKWFKISGTYRFIYKHKDDNTWGVRHRGYVDLAFRTKPGRYVLSYRARLQSEIRTAGYSNEYGKVPEIYFRNLFKAGYKVNDVVTPYLATEIRFQIQNPRIPYHNGIDRSRFIGGLDYAINQNNTFGAYFLFQKEWNVKNPETLYIIGLEYVLSID
ncbi:MAG TPA: DUF2490 domain-containing protein [Bacteroidia bacterium]|nr:DUF2490 domain-containing protein [Bacteroidia bacterium]